MKEIKDICRVMSSDMNFWYGHQMDLICINSMGVGLVRVQFDNRDFDFVCQIVISLFFKILKASKYTND